MHRPMITVFALSLAVGCANGDANSNDSAADIDAGDTVSLEIFVGHSVLSSALVGLDTCVMGTDNCTVTDSDGIAVLTVPADSDVGVTIEGEGYTPHLLPYATQSVDMEVGIYILPQETTELIMEGLGLDMSNGHVGLTLTESDGYIGTLEGGEFVHYFNDLSTGIDPDLTSTSASGRFVALNVTGDTVTVSLDGPGSCTPRDHYWSGDANEVILPVLPGYFSGMTLDCE